VNVNASRSHVLVVDDNVASGDLLQEILSLEGYTVRVAHSGQSALSVAREFVPAIALLDVGLPDMDGFALARLFRADARLAQTRLVALSGYAHPETEEQAREKIFDQYLVKPVDIEQLLSLLNSIHQRSGPASPN
jgi:DNA-binding response OmpR family regulator